MHAANVKSVEKLTMSMMQVKQLHNMLRGPIHSKVDITLARHGIGKHFTISITRHNFHEFEPDVVLSGFMGIEVTKKPPYSVLAINDLMDCNAVKQGESGYLNEKIVPGDRIIEVNGQPAEHVPVIPFFLQYIS